MITNVSGRLWSLQWDCGEDYGFYSFLERVAAVSFALALVLGVFDWLGMAQLVFFFFIVRLHFSCLFLLLLLVYFRDSCLTSVYGENERKRLQELCAWISNPSNTQLVKFLTADQDVG